MDAGAIVGSFVSALAEATPKLYELWKHLGERDAFLAAIDSMLELQRKDVDTALERKHRHE